MSDQAGERRRPVCAIAGVGPGNGEAFARRFAAEGYAVALLARNDALRRSPANSPKPAPSRVM